jgi:branched-chain amino acid aminotransferase
MPGFTGRIYLTDLKREALMLNTQFYVENGELKEMAFRGFESKGGIEIYEVIRIIESAVLFLPDHYERFKRSCKLLNVPVCVTEADFENQLYQLIEANGLKHGNVKVDLITTAGQFQTLRMYVVSHQYPTAEQYQAGVMVGLLHAERENPQAKVAQLPVRGLANRVIAENNWYEVLLVDQEDCITEGSRSNVFFVRNGVFYTARAEKVLGGITRKKIIECICQLGMACHEIDIKVSDLAEYEAAFISGTSPKILPVAQIEMVFFDVGNKPLRRLMQAFDTMIAESLRKVV